MRRWMVLVVAFFTLNFGCSNGSAADDPSNQTAQAGGTANCTDEPYILIGRLQWQVEEYRHLGPPYWRWIYHSWSVERVISAPIVIGSAWRSASAIPINQTNWTEGSGYDGCGRQFTRYTRVVNARYDIVQISVRNFRTLITQWEEDDRRWFLRPVTGWNITHDTRREIANGFRISGQRYPQGLAAKNETLGPIGVALFSSGIDVTEGSSLFPESPYRLSGTRSPENMSMQLIGTRRWPSVDPPPFPACQEVDVSDPRSLDGPREIAATYQVACVNSSVIEVIPWLNANGAESLVFRNRSMNAWAGLSGAQRATIIYDHRGCLRCSTGILP